MKLLIWNVAIAIATPYKRSREPFRDSSQLDTIDVPMVASREPTIEITNEVRANFEHQMKGNTVGMQMKMKTHLPAYNLNDNRQIKSITCLGKEVNLMFSDKKYAVEAYLAWKDKSEWIAMFDYTSCVRMLTTLKVTGIVYNQDKVISLTNVEVEPEKVIDEFEFKIDSYDNKTDGAWQKGSYNGSLVSFNVNYDPSTKEATKQLLTVIETTQGYIGCSNCFTSGHMRYGAVFKGKGLVVNSFSFFVHGVLNANMDLMFDINPGAGPISIQKTLVSLPFASLGSPGLFSFKSSMSLIAGIDLVTAKKMIATVGMDFTLPFNFEVKSEDSLESMRKETANIKPELNYHEFVSNEVVVRANTHLTPYMEFGFNVLRYKLGYALKMNNVIESEVSMGNQQCPTSHLLDMQLYANAVLITNLITRQITTQLAQTPKAKIKCPNCQKCPVKVK